MVEPLTDTKLVVDSIAACQILYVIGTVENYKAGWGKKIQLARIRY